MLLKYNCGCFIGSVVNQAHGYKRLREEIDMSKYFSSDEGSRRTAKYFLVTKNKVVENLRALGDQTLNVGSFVVLKHYHNDFVDVKLIDLENKTNVPEETVYRCLPDNLIELDERLYSLIAAISAPLERVKIAQDSHLCEELRTIEKGSVVKVLPFGFVGTVSYRGSVERLGVGTYFRVNFTQKKHSEYYTADKLRLVSSNLRNGRVNTCLRDDMAICNDQFGMDSAFEKLDDKVNGDSKPFRSQLKAGDRVIWRSETGDQPGSICWRSSANSQKARVHLGREGCREARCDRNLSTPLPVNELIPEEEYLRRKHSRSMSQMQDKRDVPVEDLLGIADHVGQLDITDQVDNYSAFETTKNYMKEIRDEEKYLRNEKRSPSLNDFGKSSRFSAVENEDSTNLDELGVGSVVEVVIREEKRYGVIKWIGSAPYYADSHLKQEMAGIEMEEEDALCSNGMLRGRKYFDCAPNRGYFCLLNHCKKDSRFGDSSFSYGGETKIPADLGCAVIQGIVEPVNPVETIHELCGKYKGIQGHNNSCYLDATLFSMFTFTSVFDSLLLRPPNKSDSSSYEEVQRVLREEIVNPLRRNFFVRAERVMNLRTLLDNLTSVTGLTCEEKDPEEFLTSLVAQVLKAEPFLKLSSGHEAYYYQLFVEKDERLKLPTVQQLFEQSLMTSDIKLKEVPSCLIIQMPRFGKSYKMYPRILPSQILDVTNVIENSPRECYICGKLAEYECKDCLKHYADDRRSCCEHCIKVVHQHQDRMLHKWTRIRIPPEYESLRDVTVPRQYMELFAVLCIETSHYVAFVKCGLGPDTPWCFFDSMADRKGGVNGYNIPEVVLCPDLPVWLSEEGARSFSEIKDDRHLPTYAKRLLCDAYMCMYQSTDIMMYR